VALLLPAIQAAREAAQRTQCLNQIRQVALACHNYESSNQTFPRATDETTFSYIVKIADFMEQNTLVAQIDTRETWDEVNNQNVLQGTVIETLKCPSTSSSESMLAGLPGAFVRQEDIQRNHYLAVMGAKVNGDPCPSVDEGGAFAVLGDCSSIAGGGFATNGVINPVDEIGFRRIADGASNTLLIGEASWELGSLLPWYAGLEQTDLTVTNPGASTGGSGTRIRNIHAGKNMANRLNEGTVVGPAASTPATPVPGTTPVPSNDASFGSLHPGVVHFALADASAKSLNENIEIEVLLLLSSRDDGQVVDTSAL